MPSLLDTMHEKNEVIMVNQLGSSTGKENSIEDQPSYLVQEAPSDDKKKLTEYTTNMEDQLTSQNQSALLPTEQKEQSKVVTDNATSSEDQSTSFDELTSPDEISFSNTLAVTYKHLSYPSKCCLLYLGLFPRLYDIPIRRLLQLWIAEGLVTQPTGNLRQLKYLGLRWTLLDSVPESVGGLPHLQTLDIKQTYVVTLPSTIWEAKKLRHLHMSEIYFDVKKSTRGSLKSLQTLWGLIIRRQLRETDWLVNLTGLRKLKLTCLEASMEHIADWLTKLSNLQSLKLRSISDSNEPARLAIKAMRNLTNLSRLYLLGLGELSNTFKVSDLPENLEVLTLSVSHLSEDPMEALGELEKLTVLKLYAHSFKGQNMTCHTDKFPQLQVLRLWMLEELQSWIVENKAMPILKEIEIRCCKNLEKVDGLENLTSLKELTLRNMKPSFIEYAREKVGDKVDIIAKDWKFPPPWVSSSRLSTCYKVLS
ncbi:Disease resistance RPM1-like protein [Theobroma cacao]|uniref:Disease resistance RPM1-like protein n=1 Tax=Theobroma cacao TaxID=3641 RepID=A0A061F3L2_THECC|nr:Disease resistance RPM1-like protein [Theobroma cacao]